MDLTERTGTRPAHKVAIGGSIALAVAAFLPWATVRSGFGQVDMAGIEGDGFFTLLLGAFVAFAASLRMDSRRWRIAMMIACGIAVLIAASAMSGLTDIAGSQYASAGVGAGLYLTFFAAVTTGIAVMIEDSSRSG